MKKRYIYALLFGIPGFLISLGLSVGFSGFGAGILWLFVFGDNPWPAYSGTTLVVLAAMVFLAAWIASIAAGFLIGKRLEKNGALNKSHIFASVGVTVLIVLFFFFQQWSVGNLGPNPESARCMDFCIQEGYSASSTPPQDSGERTCSCLDEAGREAITVPLDAIDSLK